MHPALRRSAFVVLLALASQTAYAAAPQGAQPATAQTVRPAAVPVRGFQLKAATRLTFLLGRLPDPKVQAVPGGVELHWDAAVALQIAKLPKLRELAGFETQSDASATTVAIRFTCNCTVKSSRTGSTFVLEIGASPAPAGTKRSEMDQLREDLTKRLAQLNSPAAPSPVAQAPATPPPQPKPRPACKPAFNMDGWNGRNGFIDDLRDLRAKVAENHEAAADLAALAEFYIGNGLPAEARALTRQARPGEDDAAGLQRLARDGDLARLLDGLRIDPASSLLTEPPDCTRADIPLWRALSAAAAGDAEGVARDADAARAQLQGLPEPLLQMFAYRIAQAAPDNLDTQKAMASAVRNSNIGGPEEAAGRFLIQARLARAAGARGDEINFLEHAAKDGATLSSLTARARLAEIRSAVETPDGALAAMELADYARVYRGTAFGQSAAAVLAERRLRHGDFAGALQVADESAGPITQRPVDSRGARLAAQILRQLLAEPGGAGLPPVPDRLTLYWHYQGYATPGEKGDDIRLGAAQAMLDQNMPEAALDVTRQLSEPTLATPGGARLRAAAEARAGDPAVALASLKTVPASDQTRRIEAEALSRLGQAADAAHRLDGMAAPADRLRRAGLFYAAKAWPEAAEAYAELIKDPLVDKSTRADAMDRYALALALAGKAPDSRPPETQSLAGRVLGALPSPQADTAPVAALRQSLRRAGLIETLLPPPPAKASPSPTASPGN